MTELDQLLTQATAAIEKSYFKVRIAGGDDIYRERVYCYELYHQMRLQWPIGCYFTLNGELDKVGHRILDELGAAKIKPDLLVHRQGDMQGNHAIIEVKSAKVGGKGLKKDFNTLSKFRHKVGYARAIYLIYGDNISDSLVKRIKKAAAKKDFPESIEIWLHREVGKPAFREFDV